MNDPYSVENIAKRTVNKMSKSSGAYMEEHYILPDCEVCKDTNKKRNVCIGWLFKANGKAYCPQHQI